MTLPDFFIIGAPKAATTALHAALALHPRLFMSRVKEPKFYLGPGRPTGSDAGVAAVRLRGLHHPRPRLGEPHELRRVG